MAWLTFFRPCTRVKVRVTLDASVAYFPTQNSARGLCMSLQQSSFFSSPSVIELSTLTCTSTTTMFECLDMISAKQALVLACCVEGNVLLVQSITKQCLE